MAAAIFGVSHLCVTIGKVSR